MIDLTVIAKADGYETWYSADMDDREYTAQEEDVILLLRDSQDDEYGLLPDSVVGCFSAA